jgi:hypothetical protein
MIVSPILAGLVAGGDFDGWRWIRIRGARRFATRSAKLTVMALAVSWASGCALSPTPKAPSLPGQVAQPAPATLDRDTLLDELAACHMLRVSQARDARAADAAVLAALDRYGFTPDELAARADALLPVALSQGQAFAAAGERACAWLAEHTGVPSRLVRSTGAEAARAGGVWVRYEGEITTGLATELAVHLRKERAVGLIINSPGGNVYEARKLGRYLRANELNVAVDKVCTSACIDILAGGVSRYITPRARIGIHQSSAPGSVGSHNTGQSYVASSALYLREMGIDPEVALAAASVPPSKMYWFSTSEAIKTGLATNLIRGL